MGLDTVMISDSMLAYLSDNLALLGSMIVSTQGFELLVQWLYLGRVIFGELIPEEAITATIEFVRFAGMCGITGMETLMAKRIKAIIIANPSPPLKGTRDPDTNTYCLTSQHIISAAFLPKEHPVRRILAMAAVGGYLRHDNHKLLRETQEVPNFSIDLLKSVKATLNTYSVDEELITFKDPISGEELLFKDLEISLISGTV
jgi:hypothetical protein